MREAANSTNLYGVQDINKLLRDGALLVAVDDWLCIASYHAILIEMKSVRHQMDIVRHGALLFDYLGDSVPESGRKYEERGVAC